MSDRAALYAAIVANPDEDTPRLAFADWLDEQGNKADADRARLIRDQIETTQLADGSEADAFADFLDRQVDGSDEADHWADVDAGIARRIVLNGQRWATRGRPPTKSAGIPRLG